MDKLNGLKKHRLTLVEVMIAVAVSSIAMAMILTVVLNLYAVFRDGTVDYKMVEYGHLVRQKVLRSYGLRQAFWGSMEAGDSNLAFNVVASDTEWPEIEEITNKTSLTFNASGKSLSVVSDLNSDTELAMMGIKIRDIKFDKQSADPANELSVNKMIVYVLFEKEENGKLYVREEVINATSNF